jgi:hypothetical protein
MNARLLAVVLCLLCAGARAQTDAKTAAVVPAKTKPRARRSDSDVKVAGSVVRSKEWIVRRGKTREEEFIGDVRYDAAGLKLTSDWALYRQGTTSWEVRGKVHARRQYVGGDVVETNGDKAWYNETTFKGRLEPAAGARVPLLHTPPQGEPDHAVGDLLSWIGQDVIILSGRAHGWGPRGEFWGESARYDRAPDDQSLTLTGARPVLHGYQGGDDSAAKGDKIVGYDSPRRAIVTGRAMGWFIAQSSAAPKGPSAPFCGMGNLSPGPGPDEKVTALLSPLPTSEAAEEEKRFWEAETTAFAARACPWGPRAEFWADEADYAQEPVRTITLTGGRPVLRKIEEDQNSAIKADEIVAYADARRVVATGKVKGWIVFKEEKKKSKKSDDKNSKKKKPEKK